MGKINTGMSNCAPLVCLACSYLIFLLVVYHLQYLVYYKVVKFIKLLKHEETSLFYVSWFDLPEQ